MSNADNPYGVDIPEPIEEEDDIPDEYDPVLVEYEIVDMMFVPKGKS